MADPRLEAAAIALYVAISPRDRTTNGWGDVKPVWQKDYRDSARAALAAADNAATISGSTSRIEAAAAIDELPDGSVVADTTDDVFQLRGGFWCSYESVPLTSFQLAKYAPITILRREGTE